MSLTSCVDGKLFPPLLHLTQRDKKKPKIMLLIQSIPRLSRIRRMERNST